MLQICLGLSYIFVIGWTCIGVPTVVLPREVSLFTKDAAAVINKFTASGAAFSFIGDGAFLGDCDSSWPA